MMPISFSFFSQKLLKTHSLEAWTNYHDSTMGGFEAINNHSFFKDYNYITYMCLHEYKHELFHSVAMPVQENDDKISDPLRQHTMHF